MEKLIVVFTKKTSWGLMEEVESILIDKQGMFLFCTNSYNHKLISSKKLLLSSICVSATQLLIFSDEAIYKCVLGFSEI